MAYEMEERRLVILSVLLATFLHISYGCQVDDHLQWFLPIQQTIQDVFEGVVISRSTTNIEAVNGIVYGQATIGGPYFDVIIEDSHLVVRTRESFKEYEEIETASRVSMTIEVRCTGGSLRNGLIIWIDIDDTNNNAPRFIPNEFQFIVTPPLPPGFLVTGCNNEITVRDIDLTTKRIDFTIEENPYFEIEYDKESSTEPKVFKAQLRTKTFIRSLSEPTTLTITATDVDDTNDPPLSNTTTVHIIANTEFQFPEELVFSQTFYLADYTEDHQLNLLETISLEQGFDEYVKFTLEGEYAGNHFNLITEGNQATIVVVSPLPVEIWAERQIFLIAKAEREFTSGGSATIIVQLPEEVDLQFERAHYEGIIINNSLQLSPLVLSQGFENVTVSADVVGEWSTYFSSTVQGPLVTLTMLPLTNDIIDNNNFISVQVVVSSGRSSAVTIVNLEIIKDDNVTPVFDKLVYNGTYDPVTGLDAEQIHFVQGFDGTVTVDLIGEHAEYFGFNPNGPIITLTSSTLPPEIFGQQNILISIEAKKPRTVGANAAIYISLPAARELEFEESTYRGTIKGNNLLSLQTITLLHGYEEGVDFSLSGEHATYFTATNDQNQVSIVVSPNLPTNVITQNNVITLTLTASGLNAIPTTTSIILDIIKDDTTTPVFSQNIYYGTYSGSSIDIEAINLAQGLSSDVSFRLDGAHAQYFLINETDAVITLQFPIPEEVIFKEKVFVFNVIADKTLTVGANAAVLIRFPTELTDSTVMRFSQNTYVGTLEENEIRLANIILETGFAADTEFNLFGDHAEHFRISHSNNVLQILSLNTLPNEVVENNDIIVLEVEARRLRAVSVRTSVVIEIVKREVITPVFSQAYYTGTYTEQTGLTFEETINLLEGYDETVTFALSGESATWFVLEEEQNSLSLALESPVPIEVLQNNNQLLFTVVANKPNGISSHAVVSIDLPKEIQDAPVVLGFDRVSYEGSIENNQATVPTITLSEGYTPGAVQFTLHGALSDYFSVSPQGPVATVNLQRAIPEQSIPANRIIVLAIQATAPQAIPAHATIVLKYVVEENISPTVELIFAQTFYSGSYAVATGLTFPTTISLSQGYTPEVKFDLEGDHAEWFDVVQQGNSATLVMTSPIPSGVLANNQQLVFVVTAQSPSSAITRATIVISLTDGLQPGPDVSFEKIIFEGIIQNGIVNHETITVTGFSGSNIELHGVYSALFDSDLSSSGIVTVTLSGSLNLPTDVNQVVLVLRADNASAVLLLNVIHTDVPVPTVTFSSTSYAIRVDITHTGLVGQVQASADNGEAVTYSLLLDNVHLLERLSINEGGELHLSAPLNSGAYTFSVVATTVFTQIQGTATVHLSVETVTVCGDEYVIPPLIVLDVDEEEPHYDLINGTQYDNCHFTLTNRWPVDQSWLYVDERGLHTTSIDREHESIAFMPVSQVQVEVTLHCEGDSTRIKRSSNSDALGPYDYGTNKWILTDTILYNSRRSFVNVIVNDINDNAPIFVGKDNEPIVVGYPVPNLAERILPRSLAELQATDADIGENAAVVYWSGALELAVAPTTGFVHLRHEAKLEDGSRLSVSATDRNGHADGLTGSIDILVRLLDENYIAVVTVQNAFLDDEQTVLSHLSEVVGYEVRVLRSVVVSVEDGTRRKRDISSSTGALLQMYVYGLVAREPVTVEKLIEDISTTIIGPVIIASMVSLQDHLEGQEMCDAGRDTGLLVATIILSVLLFIVLVLIAVWFFLRWRKNKNYDEFSDENSLASRNESVNTLPKPELLPKPRLDITELKKSEKRLQEMLDAPVDEISVQPIRSRNDAILDMPTPDPNAPIVIQSIDKLKDAEDESSEDEFGEIVTPKRKSVVTFNENVEKIIHVEDTPDSEDLSSDPDYEVYKL